MKRIIVIACIGFAASCSDGKLDEGKLNAAGDKLQKAVEKGADSVASKAERLADTIERRTDKNR